MWMQWVVLPSFALNADHVWALWKDWFGAAGGGMRRVFWWLGLFTLIEWQFWVTGFRTGDWWGGAGSGKDLVVLVVVISSLGLLSQKPTARNRLWLLVVGIAFLAVTASLLIFYQQYAVSEQRFRLVWRYQPGFNAVTTGLLVGFALVAAWGPWAHHEKVPAWGRHLVLLVFGIALAASESRGALLAVLAAGAVHLARKLLIDEGSSKRGTFSIRTLQELLVPCAGFLVYWLLAFRQGEASGGDLVNRGSAGRLEIYGIYLSQLSPLDWIFGKGRIPSLAPEELGWLVHHTHNAYLGQLVSYGVLGAVALALILLFALWKIRRTPEVSLVTFGLVACLFDGGQIVTILSLARWETLVVLVPLIVAVTRIDSVRTASL